MDAKERVIRRLVTIVAGGMTSKDHPGIHLIYVSEGHVKEVVQQAADAIGGR